jgi:hypothetical protein
MRLYLEKKMNRGGKYPYRNHLQSFNDLITSYEATRAGFVSLALEKNRRATPYIAEAQALQKAASSAKKAADLKKIKGIEKGLLTAAGLSDKALGNLLPQDKEEAINGLIKNFLEPAGIKFIKELVYRFLLIRGDALGGSMRNIGGVLAQRKLTRSIISTLLIAGLKYEWFHAQTKKWIEMADDDSDIELSLGGLSWNEKKRKRTLLFNLIIPFLKNNVDFCLFNLPPSELETRGNSIADSYVAIDELKGGIDPAGADEHWKTAQTALDRIRDSFSRNNVSPYTFYIGAAIEKKMTFEIWKQLENGSLANAANLNNEDQVASISRWICNL